MSCLLEKITESMFFLVWVVLKKEPETRLEFCYLIRQMIRVIEAPKNTQASKQTNKHHTGHYRARYHYGKIALSINETL